MHILTHPATQPLLIQIAPRYSAVARDGAVIVTIEGGPAKPEGHAHRLHPKFPDRGNKVSRPARFPHHPLLPKSFSHTPAPRHQIIVRANSVFIEGDDAQSLKEGTTVLLLSWDTCKVKSLQRDSSGRVVGATFTFTPGEDFKKAPKLTWVANVVCSCLWLLPCTTPCWVSTAHTNNIVPSARCGARQHARV